MEDLPTPEEIEEMSARSSRKVVRKVLQEEFDVHNKFSVREKSIPLGRGTHKVVEIKNWERTSTNREGIAKEISDRLTEIGFGIVNFDPAEGHTFITQRG